ncbi:MAG: flagellar biosynthesis protein FliQ [Lachnospiraceae bacterium]|nr:flagellar biosynthesis protein FliQ [Ruminococcus sp.]MCM1273849.1 flagellar biosynthesis protein FliQ [Lachnospiraceae bacterium]
MTQDVVMEIFREAIMLAFKLALPVLLVAMIVGLVIAILQAATQIHEQTISFAPKAVAVGLTLFFLAPWMTNECIDFVSFIFEKMAQIPIT